MSKQAQTTARPATSIELVISNDLEHIKALVKAGYCPIECSVGGETVVDELKMDHHGEMSHLEPVSVRAYRDHFGARKEDPRFIGCGAPDMDMTFAAASLAGLLPHPSVEVAETLPPHIKASKQKDLLALAETIARIDASPIGLDIPSMPYGETCLTWYALSGSNARDSLAFSAGVALWRQLTTGNPRTLTPYLSAAKTAEEARIAEARLDREERAVELEEGVLLIEGSRSFGFDVWYGRVEDAPADSLKGWKHPVVLAHLEASQNVTIGCPNDVVADALFGPGGLKGVFSELNPSGWGGRESIGGSPRGEKLSPEQAMEAAQNVVAILQEKRKK